jgi:mono/diheme cytochrome c family protein
MIKKAYATGARKTLVWATSLALLFSLPAHALEPDAQRGLTFVSANCAQCHAVDKVSPSQLGAAPPFRTLHNKYPVADLAESFAEGITTGHPTMPEFRLDSDQVGDVIAFLKTLEQ